MLPAGAGTVIVGRCAFTPTYTHHHHSCTSCHASRERSPQRLEGGAQSPWGKLQVHQPPKHKQNLQARPLSYSQVGHALHTALSRSSQTCNTWTPPASWLGCRRTTNSTIFARSTSQPGWSLRLHESAGECRYVTYVCMSPCTRAAKPQSSTRRHHIVCTPPQAQAHSSSCAWPPPCYAHDWQAIQPHIRTCPYLAALPRTAPPTTGNNSNGTLFRHLHPTHAYRTCSGTCRRGLAATL